MREIKDIPISLYIHTPWCVQKCPYCDFNSHALKAALPESQYCKTLLRELDTKHHLIGDRVIQSIFIGGGTPSLFSAKTFAVLLQYIKKKFVVSNTVEITLEANPGTIEQQKFSDYRKVGINRLSIGVQSFDEQQLKRLGRIHNSDEAKRAIDFARRAGFDNFNLDLMFGLEGQTVNAACSDLEQAIRLAPPHVSWYQLTLEPNTLFHKYPPPLPNDDTLWSIQTAGQAFLHDAGYTQYEISAYTKHNKRCQHNLNYWMFGDYLGIGAGAHSKITTKDYRVSRHANTKHPRSYLTSSNPVTETSYPREKALSFEFMLNTARLKQSIPFELFFTRTGQLFTDIEPQLIAAAKKNFVIFDDRAFTLTEHGHQFLNEYLELFL